MGACMCKKKHKEAGDGKSVRRRSEKRRSKLVEDSVAYRVSTKEDFENRMKAAGENLVVIDFYATWCGPCKMIKPKVEELAKSLEPENVTFLKIDVDECEDVTNDYGISSMPTFVLVKNNEKKEEMAGVNLERLKELIDKHK